MKRHPIQPLEPDDNGVVRFKANRIVSYLLDNGGIDMNRLAMLHFEPEERAHFAQLIGYSLSGYGELSYVSDADYGAAEGMANGSESEDAARIADLEQTLEAVRKGLKDAATAAFRIHPDDLVI